MRNYHIDMLRVLCLASVVVHHAEIRFAYEDYESYDGPAYPLSNELWVLWYLVAISGFSFVVSRRPMKSYLLRISALFAFGVACNGSSLWITHQTITVERVIYQMYYVLLVGVLSIGTHSIKRWWFDAVLPSPTCVVLSQTPYVVYSVFLLWDASTCDVETWIIVSALHIWSWTFAFFRSETNTILLAILVYGCSVYCVWESVSTCRRRDYTRCTRFAFWWTLGTMSAFLAESANDAIVIALDRFTSCVTSYWMIFVFAFTFGQPTLQQQRYTDLISYDTWTNVVVALRDATLVVLFVTIVHVRTSDPWSISRPLTMWSVLAYVTHQAIFYLVPSTTRDGGDALVFPHAVDVVQVVAIASCVCSAMPFVASQHLGRMSCALLRRQRPSGASVTTIDGDESGAVPV